MRQRKHFLRLALPLLFGLTLGPACTKQGQEVEERPSSPIPEIPGWQLVWHDEFEGDRIDPTRWEHEVNARGGGNNELQYYTARRENAYVQNGRLVIRALKERYTGPEGTREYTSARLRTKHKGDWRYGRFDIRARLPRGKGLWPAIWMLPTDNVYGGWAASGEIDIMELVGDRPNQVFGTLHYGGEYPNNRHSGATFTLPLSEGTFNDAFHLFTLEWDTTEFRWYVDGFLYQTQNSWYTDNAPYPAPFDQRFHLILNVAVGGNLPGNPDASTEFPQVMEVDYVRVYQKVE
ncbi:MAG: glycoside hydrolase family 16 protein [Calditrichaeota bacterium]|nr:MAG: glycoside hydrolase family 16 protein [Calditrichota bacterium]